MRLKPPTAQATLQKALTHWSEAFGLAHQLTGDRDRAEELCQEAFARLSGMKREIDQTRSLRPLVLKIVRNLGFSERRRKTVSSLDAHLETGASIVDPSALDPAHEAGSREEIALVRNALDELRESWRTTLYLRDGLGLSYVDIADVLDTSVDVVRVTLHRARSRIRSSLSHLISEGRES